MVERRRAERVKSLLKAKILYNNRMTSFDCVVKNMSSLGAKLSITQDITVPTNFELEIPMRGKTFRARMRWRDADGMGVEFVDEVDAREPGNARFEQLQAENARLKAAIQILTKKLEDLGQDVPKFS